MAYQQISKENMMKILVILKHKPVIVSKNYEEIDGRQAGNTDAQEVSIGLAQWEWPWQGRGIGKNLALY